METAFYGNPGASRFKKGFFVLSCRIARIATFFFQRGEKERKGFYHYHMFFSIVYSFLMRFLLFFRTWLALD